MAVVVCLGFVVVFAFVFSSYPYGSAGNGFVALHLKQGPKKRWLA